MKSTLMRMVLAVVVVSLITAATWGFRGSVEARVGELPTDWDINDFPMEFDNWKGQEKELDERLFVRTDADVVMNRNYTNSNGNGTALHVALFKRPGKGLEHQPPVCYEGNGWRESAPVSMYIKDAEGNDLKIYAGKWGRKGETKLMAYWYQFGEHIMFNRWDMGVARWKMRGKEAWPVVIKVLLDFPIETGMDEEEQLQEVAQKVYDWTNQIDRTEAEEP